MTAAARMPCTEDAVTFPNRFSLVDDNAIGTKKWQFLKISQPTLQNGETGVIGYSPRKVNQPTKPGFTFMALPLPATFPGILPLLRLTPGFCRFLVWGIDTLPLSSSVIFIVIPNGHAYAESWSRRWVRHPADPALRCPYNSPCVVAYRLRREEQPYQPHHVGGQ